MASIDNTKPVSSEIAIKADLRGNLTSIKGKIDELPDSLDTDGNEATAHVGKVVVIGSGGARVVASSDTADLANAIITNGRFKEVAITGNTSLVTASHGDAFLVVTSASTVTITVDASNVSSGFRCTLVQDGAGRIAIVAAGGLTLRSSDSYSKSSKQYDAISLVRSGSNLYLFGATAA